MVIYITFCIEIASLLLVEDTTGPEYCGLNESIANWRLN
jgi:hypothetical protein